MWSINLKVIGTEYDYRLQMGLKEALRELFSRAECHKLIRYDQRTIRFKSLGAGYGEAKFSLGEFQTEVKKIRAASELADALDDYQYNMCTSTRSLRRDDPDWKKFFNWRMAAISLLTAVRTTLAAFKIDPHGQRKNLYSVVKDMQKFMTTIAKEAMRPTVAAVRRRKTSKAIERKRREAISIAFRASGLRQQEASRLVDEFAEKRAGEIRKQIGKVEKRRA